jgi:predicted transcriptional regulator/GNAT superfamily N-acetyltransferase
MSSEVQTANLVRQVQRTPVGASVRPYLASDRPMVTRALQSLPALYPNGRRWLRQRLDDAEVGAALVLLMYANHMLVGVLIETPKGLRSRKLSTLWVRPSHRGRGIGAGVLRRRMDAWRAAHLDEVYCTVPLVPGNGALACLLKVGFEVTAVAKDRYTVDRDEAILTWRPAGCSSASSELLISIREGFAESIFDGTKKSEVRRRRPHIWPGTICWVYVPQPVGAVTGRFISGAITCFDPRDGAALSRLVVGTSDDAIISYLGGSTRGWSIEVLGAERLANAVHLPSGFHPPQMYLLLRRESRVNAHILSLLHDSGESARAS